jgi:hypothetical protein
MSTIHSPMTRGSRIAAFASDKTFFAQRLQVFCERFASFVKKPGAATGAFVTACCVPLEGGVTLELDIEREPPNGPEVEVNDLYLPAVEAEASPLEAMLGSVSMVNLVSLGASTWRRLLEDVAELEEEL